MKFDLNDWVKLQQENKDVIVTLNGTVVSGMLAEADDVEGYVGVILPDQTGPQGEPMVMRHYGTVTIRVIESLGVSVSDDVKSREAMG